jgi:3-oxoacyl-[acyl-carrier-protein] synthase-1
MATSAKWTGSLSVTGIGLVTPVGLCADASLAALRAGVSRLSTMPNITIASSPTEQEPVIGASVPKLTEGQLGPARLLAMMRPAFAECLEDAGVVAGQRLGVFLGTSGSSPAGRRLNYDQALKETLLASVPEGLKIERATLVPAGRAAVQKAIRSAANALEQDQVDVAVIGAVDSWVTPRALHWLKINGKLPEYPRHTGNIPGEAAGFLVLESPAAAASRKAPVYANIVASAGEHETIQWGEANNALVLSRAIRSVVEGVEDEHAVVISDLDGERYRAMEWVMAEPKGMWKYHTLDHWNPADCVGDSGAAMGAVMLAWACVALNEDYAGSKRILVWGASNEGAREAVLIESVGVTA